jgi:hypothetical protein
MMITPVASVEEVQAGAVAVVKAQVAVRELVRAKVRVRVRAKDRAQDRMLVGVLAADAEKAPDRGVPEPALVWAAAQEPEEAREAEQEPGEAEVVELGEAEALELEDRAAELERQSRRSFVNPAY